MRWALVGLLLLAWALRLPPFFRSPLHPDEALYGYWGLLIGQGRDAWLRTVPVYKPPLLPYAIAGSQLLLGDTTAALRLPGLASGMLTIPIIFALSRALYRDRRLGAMAAVVVALLPYAVVFSGSAFPDPLMVALGLAACLAAGRGQPRRAGLLTGLSFAAKQTGLVWIPLTILVQSLDLGSRGAGRRALLSLVGHWAIVIALVFAWDVARVSQGGASFWQTGVVGFGGMRVIWPQEMGRRLREWLALLRYLSGSAVLNAVLLLGLPALVATGLLRSPRTRHTLIDLLLTCFLLIFVLFHWLLAFPIWDRYLLPLAPVFALLLGRIVRAVSSRTSILASNWRTVAGFVLLVASLALPSYQASAGRHPINHDRDAYHGIQGVIDYFQDLPTGSVVYHHWLGWHYRFALSDAPIYLAYWPDPAWLARDVRAFGRQEPRYITFPAWESPARVEHHLRGVGYALDPVLTVPRVSEGSRSFTVYRLVPLPG